MEMIEKIRRKYKVVKAVKYGRFSSDMQREESIEAQDLAMDQFAKNNNITIVDAYYDRAKSGTGADREEFQRLLKDSVKHEFHLVLVHKVDRFARNRQDSMNARFHLKRNGVSVVATSQLYDSESPEGMMMEAMLEAMAEYYSKNLANEVEKGKRMNAMKGLHVGGRPPFGFDVDRSTMKLVVNEQEAEAVRMIFTMAAKERSYHEIVDLLHLGGYKTKAERDFGYNTIHEILRNEKYTGVYIYSKSAPKDLDGKRNGHAYKDDEDIIRIEGGCPAIISKELFAQVKARMLKRRRIVEQGKGNVIETYLLTSKIRCGLCDSNYEGLLRKQTHDHPRRVSYRCSKKNHSVHCSNREIERDALEGFVLGNLAKLVFDDSIIPEIVQSYNEYQGERDCEALGDLQRMETNRKALKREIDNIVGVISQTGSAALAEHLTELEDEKARLDVAVSRIKRDLSIKVVSTDDLRLAFEMARKLLQNKTLENTKELVRVFVDKVLMYPDRVEISYNIGFKTEIFNEKPHHTDDKNVCDVVPVTIEPSRAMVYGGGEGGI